MAEERNSRKRPLSIIEISDQLLPPFQKSRLSNEETTVCVPAATSGASSSNHHSSICLPSSSTATPTRWKYDVFLSFRGSDTRQGITSDIHHGLESRGIRTFMDDPDLHKGDPISHKLMEAIEGSRFAIVVLSPHYADSPWCLEELVKICECMGNDSNVNRIFPIFYHVEPTEVRYQNNGSFEEAFTKHEASGWHQPGTMDKWRAALKQVADFSAWTTYAFKTHRELIDDVVQTLRKKVAPNAIESTADFQPYEETIKVMNEVNEALRDEKVTVVGVHGMGGVGKTTMVKHVAEQARKDGTFNGWIMATISQNHDVKRIQSILSGFLGVELDEKSEVEIRAAKLLEEFKNRDKLLIILDDVWDKIDLSEIGIPDFNSLQHCSSNLLLTTRRLNVCQSMQCQKKIILKSLSEQDSWTLFVRKTGCSFESPTFECVARKVAGECKGLPIALIAVAGALGDKDLAEWERAAQRLEKSQPANLDDNEEAFKCIKLSYDYLKDEECKSFFLLCCLYPEDSDIEIDQVFKYGMGIGLFQDAETLKEGQGRAVSVANHLKNSSLLLETYNSELVRLHDVIRDAAIRIAKSEGKEYFVRAGCGLKQWPLPKKHDDFTAISLMNNAIRKLPETLVCPKLQILLLDGNYYIKEIPETFFQIPNDLRVLDLGYMRIFSLPQSFSLLTNLTFLSLLGCGYLSCDTSTLGNLKKLEILYLSNIDSEGLSIELRGLTNLRIFSCYNDAFIHRIPAGVISEWKHLEELHIKGFGGWGCGVKGKEGEETANASFEEVIGLSKLRVLKTCVALIETLPTHVDLVPELVGFDITVGFKSYLWNDDFLPRSNQSIRLFLNNISDLPEWFSDGLMKNADIMYWEGCQNLSDIFVDLEHWRLPKLRHLYLYGKIRGSFMLPKLRHLHMTLKERFTNDEIEQSSEDEIGESFKQDESRRNPIRIPLLQNLEKLTLSGLSLEGFQTLPPDSLLNLEKLELINCYSGNSLISLAKSEIIDIYQTRLRYIFGHDVLVVSLPLNIRTIILVCCSIIGICEGRTPPTMFQNLQALRISDCNKLEGSLFTHEVAQCLPQLYILDLERCPLLERIVEADNNKTILPILRCLYLEKCPMLYCGSGSLDIECPSLEMFKLSECPKFAASFDDFNSRKQQKPYSWYEWRLIHREHRVIKVRSNIIRSEDLVSLKLAVVDNKL